MPYWGPILYGWLAILLALGLTGGWAKSSKSLLCAWLWFLTVYVCWALVIVQRQLPVRDVLGRWPSAADARLLVGAVLACLGVHLGWLYVMDHMGWLPELPDQPHGAIAIAASHFAIVVLAPPVEEILFRGILLPKLAGRVGPLAGALLSSALFGVLHFDQLGSFLFGLVMVCLYVRTRSLWAPTLAHGLNNFLAMSLDAAGLLMPPGWVVVGAVVVSFPWLATFLVRGLRDRRIPGVIETVHGEPQPEGAEQTASAVAAASAPEPEPLVIVDETKAETE